MNRGLDDGLSKAFELALTPVLVAGMGWFIDTRIETIPLFTLVFFFLGVIGTSLSLWYRYDAAMVEEQRRATEARAERTPRRSRSEVAG